jgi:hypothetical protein
VNILNTFTYGNTKAARILSELVETERVSKKVGRVWNDFTFGFNAIISEINDISLKKTLADMWMQKTVQRISTSKFSKKLETFFINVVKAKYKIFIKNIETNEE